MGGWINQSSVNPPLYDSTLGQHLHGVLVYALPCSIFIVLVVLRFLFLFLSCPRGIFTLSSSQPLPTAPPAIPSLNLSGRVPPKNSAVGLEHVDKPADMSTWAEFHNGVAAGLKIAPGISQVSILRVY